MGGASASGIPEGLTWTAQTLQSQEDGDILAAAEGTSYQDLPRLDLTAQVEDGTITLTDHAAGETCTGTLYPAEDADPNAQVYTWRFRPAGGLWGVRGHRIRRWEPGRHPVSDHQRTDPVSHRPLSET